MRSKPPRSNPSTERCPCKGIWIYIHYFVLSLSLHLALGRKKVTSVERTLLPVPLTCFYFPRLPAHKKKQQTSSKSPPERLQAGLRGRCRFFLLKARSPAALNICASWRQASEQISGAPPWASPASEASSLASRRAERSYSYHPHAI